MKHFKRATITQERSHENGYVQQCTDEFGEKYSIPGTYYQQGTEGWVGYYSTYMGGWFVFTTVEKEAQAMDELRSNHLLELGK